VNNKKSIGLLALICSLTLAVVAKEKTLVATGAPTLAKTSPIKKSTNLLSFNKGASSAELAFRNVTESTYAKHSELFSKSGRDQYFYTKSTWDLAFTAVVNEWLNTKITIRNKATWGNETSVVATTSETFKIGDAVAGSHKHYVAKLVPWIKEAWVDFSLNKALGLNDSLRHNAKLGSFGFKLGRGISLGSAYSVSSGILGFYSSGVVDQYAFGNLIYGDIKKDKLSYNVYSAILENYSDKFSRVNAATFASQIGRRENPERGFGQINFVIATNLKWTALDGSGDLGKLVFEPYIMFNRAPEQKVEFTADASSHLATFGLSAEYAGSRFDWGYELAGNFGSQDVRAWDRNQIIVARDSDGMIKNFYSHVRRSSSSGTATSKAIVTGDLKTIVNSSVQNTIQNSQLVGKVGSIGYYNDPNRFRGAYTNQYKGFMFVADVAYSLTENKKLKLVSAVGWASGDENPNKNLEDGNDTQVDGDYQGFFGLQEVYSGKRVPSVFVIGSNDVVRPLSSPQNGFATNISGFTNLVYIGGGVDWQVKAFNKGWRIKSNLLSYWQDKATKKYDTTTKLSSSEYADKHLGTEINTSVRVNLINGLAGFFTGGVFVPGQHYDDIKGKPLNGKQLKALDSADSTGFPSNGVPVIGTTTSFVLNWGLEFSF
jgi:hypothetical protein